MNEYKLYFGRRTQAGDNITPGSVTSWLQKIVDPSVKAYTANYGRGAWEGQQEDSLVLTIIAPSGIEPTLRLIAQSYITTFNQAAVFLTTAPLLHAEVITLQLVALPKAA